MRPGSPLRLQPFPPTETAPALNTRHRPANRCPTVSAELRGQRRPISPACPPSPAAGTSALSSTAGTPPSRLVEAGAQGPYSCDHCTATGGKGRADRVDTPAATQLLRSRLSPSPPPPATWIALPANPRTPRHDSRRPADRRYPYPHSFEESRSTGDRHSSCCGPSRTTARCG